MASTHLEQNPVATADVGLPAATSSKLASIGDCSVAPHPSVCAICFDTFGGISADSNVERCLGPTNLTAGRCAHHYCVQCLRGYVLEKLQRHIVDERDIHCPECSQPAEVETIRDLLGSDPANGEANLQRWVLLRQLQADPAALSCPACATVCRPAKSSKTLPWKQANTKVVCQSCSLEFCSIHSDAHPGRSCKQFEKQQAKAIAMNEAYIARRTVHPCPKCAFPIEKNGGCVHMTCSQCKYEFCWCCRHSWKLHRDIRNSSGAKGAVAHGALALLCPGSALPLGRENWGAADIWAARGLLTVGAVPCAGVCLGLGAVACAAIPVAAGYQKAKSAIARSIRNAATAQQRHEQQVSNQRYEQALEQLTSAVEQLSTNPDDAALALREARSYYIALHGVPPPSGWPIMTEHCK